MTQLPTLMDMFSRLVAAPSVSSVNADFDQSNREVVELLEVWLSALGLKVELLQVAAAPAKYNLIARTHPGGVAGGLVLAGHTDTVPCDAAAWHSDPFTITERDGRLYGLGTSDMKCFFAIVIDALKGLEHGAFKHPLTVLATADEESSMNGARALAQSGVRLGQYALIGEPTGCKPIHAHKGVMMESIKIQGRAGHASEPALGNSALEGMHRVITRLLEQRAALQARFKDVTFKVSEPTLNLGYIHGGDNPNRICGECELQIDIRLLPGMSVAQLRVDLSAAVDEAIAGSGLHARMEPLFPGVPAFRGDGQTRYIRLLESLSGQPAGAVAFATEAPFLAELGMETAILGPGDIAQAHQADEYIAMERLAPMRRLIERLVREVCAD